MSEEINVSKSKQKREARKEEVKAEKSKKNWDKIFGWIIGLVIAAVVIGAIVLGIISSLNSVEASADYSAGLNAEGCIQGADLGKVGDLGLDSLVVPLSEVELTEEELEAQIQENLEATAFDNTDPAATVADGDTINLDYVGYIDDVAFDGGNTQGAGATLVIGSGNYIDDFEQQLIGYHPGDDVTVNVTFPEEYSNNPDLAGKDARFECTINSVRTVPELTNLWVDAYYYEHAHSIEEYKAFLKDEGYKNKLTTYLQDYVYNNAINVVSKFPSAYLKNLQAVIKYSDEQTYEYYNSYFQTYYGQKLYESFNDFTGMTDEEYVETLKENAKKEAAQNMVFEKYFKDHNLTVSEEDYNYVVTAAGGISTVSQYGEPFLKQASMIYTVIQYLSEHVTVQ